MELIEVRPDERFEVLPLAEWLRAELGIEGYPVVRQFAGGKANLTYLLTMADGSELVLRRPPLGPLAPGAHDMSREYGVLSRLYQVFDKAPRALAYCENPEVIGSTFFVMERKPGVVVRESVPEIFGAGADPEANRALSAVVVDTLAELHDVSPESCGLGDLGRPAGFLGRQVEGWTARWEDAREEEAGVAAAVASWLEENIPRSDDVTLLHNDWRLDNMAVSPQDPGVCVAVYDWDMATRGDPLADLGTLMASWYDPGEVPSSLNPMPTTASGWIRRDEAVARYEGLTGRDVSAFPWYLVFGTWKMGVVLQQIFIRWRRGQTADDRFSVLGEGARHLFELAASRQT